MSNFSDRHRTVPTCVIPECSTDDDDRKLVLIAGRPQWVCLEHAPEET